MDKLRESVHKLLDDAELVYLGLMHPQYLAAPIADARAALADCEWPSMRPAAAERGEYPPLPEPFMELHREIAPTVYNAWADQMRAYVDADRAQRVTSQVVDLATPSGGLEAGPEEERIEASYWRFDARHKGHGQWKQAPMSERDAFKAEMRNALEAEKVRAEMRLVGRGWRPVSDADRAQRVPLPDRLIRFTLRDLKAKREALSGFVALGNELERAREYDQWILSLERYLEAAKNSGAIERAHGIGAKP